jgi:hypothetical protein
MLYRTPARRQGSVPAHPCSHAQHGVPWLGIARHAGCPRQCASAPHRPHAPAC